MNCDEITALFAADVDGEMDSLRSHAIRRHVAGCSVCGPRYQALLELKQRLRTELPRHGAPASLRARVASDLSAAVAPGRTTSPDRRWSWFGAGALSGGLVAGLVWAASLAVFHVGRSDDLSSLVVGLHTRATLGNHLIEVASSDRHTVKPWLSARLDYSIPVTDGAQAGFPLIGARVDQLEGQPVATLVYRRRDHIIDVFVRPSDGLARRPALHLVRGFNVMSAQGAEMEWLAVSDLQGTELAAFVQGLAQAAVKPAVE
jgi:anti-sigma factor RsiW